MGLKSIPGLNLQSSTSAYLFLLSLYSCALLMDHGIHWLHPKTTAILALLTAIQFLNYKLWWASALTIVLGISTSLPYFPQTANHTNIMLIGSIIIVILLLFKLALNQSPGKHHIALTFRWAVIAIYFWAGFHKLNSGFFSIDGTCSVHINHYLNQILFGSDFKPAALWARISQIGTIVIEMVVPFGLLFFTTRKIAAIILVVFHFYLALCNFTNFSAFACFLIIGSIISLNDPITNRHKTGLKIYQTMVLLSIAVSILLKKFKITETISEFLLYSNMIFSLGFIIFFIVFFSSYKPIRETGKMSYLQPIIVIIVSLWAFQGYVGLSNSSTLTMFSNLVTEKSRSNHFIINTEMTKIWDFEEDYVEIIDFSSKNNLGKRYNLKEYYIPLAEFKNSARAWTRGKDEVVECTIKYRGKTIHIKDLKKHKFIEQQWWKRFLTYRGIRKDGKNECLW